jgi:hypothetical protein
MSVNNPLADDAPTEQQDQNLVARGPPNLYRTSTQECLK